MKSEIFRILKPEELPEKKILQPIIPKLSIGTTGSENRGIKHDRNKPDDSFKEVYKQSEESRYKEDLTKGLIAENGGMILLWPYLDILFSQFRVLSGNRFKGVEEQTAAVYMLHYLATGSVHAEEHELLMPKILTAYDLDEPVPVNFNLDANVRTECDHLILSVIKHWVALKSTSPDGLRRTFLQRCALIKLKEDGWHFMLERKEVDVLMDRLPYALSLIKLKWLDNPIYVSW